MSKPRWSRGVSDVGVVLDILRQQVARLDAERGGGQGEQASSRRMVRGMVVRGMRNGGA